MPMQTLKEISNEKAKKQPGMVNALLEDSPILAACKWDAASHGLWNVGERVEDVTGPGFVPANSPLPTVDMTTELVKTDLDIMGGEMEVPKDTADQFGGPEKYFSRKQDAVLKKAGMDAERRLYYNNWLAAAIANGKAQNAGATTGGVYSMVFCRFDPEGNKGLYDPAQFDQGRLLRITPLSGGSMYHLRSMPGVSGFGVQFRGRFGWQILNPKCVSAICNIQSGKIPTATMIDFAISAVRGTPANTRIFMHENCRILAINPYKDGRVQYNPNDSNANTLVEAWGKIPIVTSYNMDDGTETVVSGI